MSSPAFGRVPASQKHFRVVLIGSFCFLLILAIGVPILGKPKVQVVAPAPAPVIAQVDVIAPAVRIPAGAVLTESMLKTVQIPQSNFDKLGDAVVQNVRDAVGRYTRVALSADKPITNDQLLDRSENMVTRKIAPGQRAVTIKVDDVTGIEGWGTPGAKVDVLWISPVPNGNDQSITVIVKNAQVLSVLGQIDPTQVGPQASQIDPAARQQPVAVDPKKKAGAEPAANKPNILTSFTVTLQVSPEDGKKLYLASATGKLALMLRGDTDPLSNGDQADSTLVQKNLFQGTSGSSKENLEGTVKIKREDGSYDEWSVIDGKVWRWDREDGSPS